MNPDVVIVGSGPNALAGAVTMARAGLKVQVYERAATIGGGARTQELTLPGFRHDVCSAIHPMAVASPFFQKFGLEQRVEFITPELSYGQPLDGGRAGFAYRDLDRTVDGLGKDGAAWGRLMRPLVDNIADLVEFTGSSLINVPRHPVTTARFGLRVLEQGSPAWRFRFDGDIAPALLAGVNAHAIGRMPRLSSAGAGLMLGANAHAGGWPLPRGGSQAIIDAMAEDLIAHGGAIETGTEITSVAEFSGAKAVLLDVSARGLDRIVGDQLPDRYRKALRRFKFGDGVAKIDFALSGPVKWANPELDKAGTIHVGGTRAEVARSEDQVARGAHPSQPYVLVSQPSVFDDTRAPAGKHVLWAYAHVPHGSSVDMTEAITSQIERFAPGFRDLVLASSHRSAVEIEQYNPNYVGGDISSGAVTTWQLLKRPVVSLDPWRTPAKGIYLCSSATPPGTAVHGLCGWYAALSALKHEFGITQEPDLSPV